MPEQLELILSRSYCQSSVLQVLAVVHGHSRLVIAMILGEGPDVMNYSNSFAEILRSKLKKMINILLSKPEISWRADYLPVGKSTDMEAIDNINIIVVVDTEIQNLLKKLHPLIPNTK